MDINWDEAPEGFDYALTTAPDWEGAPEYKGTIRFAKKRENSTYFECDQGLYPHVGQGSWVVVATRPEKWNGKGLPPVGTVCEACVSGIDNWFKCSVLIHHPDEVGVVGVHDTVGNALLWTDTFRPLKTKEQLAAEEREKAIREMVETCYYPGSTNTYADCEALYDAGYRRSSHEH